MKKVSLAFIIIFIVSTDLRGHNYILNEIDEASFQYPWIIVKTKNGNTHTVHWSHKLELQKSDYPITICYAGPKDVSKCEADSSDKEACSAECREGYKTLVIKTGGCDTISGAYGNKLHHVNWCKL